MTTFMGKHAVAIFAIAASLTGLGMGASGVYQLHQYEIQQPTFSASTNGCFICHVRHR
jgi:hypothetical protein